MKIKDRYPLPRMSKLMDRFRTAKVFTKLDLKDRFNFLRIAKEDECKSEFRTRYGLYQSNAMPFGLCNASSTFQPMISEVVHDLLVYGVVVYVDDILIDTESMMQYEALIHKLLQWLRDSGLHSHIEMSFSYPKEV
jgi:hypothetical protein